jgi:hypothetical protein
MNKKSGDHPGNGHLLVWAAIAILSFLYLMGWLFGYGIDHQSFSPIHPFLLITRICSRFLFPLFITASIFTASLCGGGVLLDAFDVKFDDTLTDILFSIATGLGLCSTLVLVIGSAGMLEPYVFWTLIVLLLLAGFNRLQKSIGAIVTESKQWLASLNRQEWFLVGAGLFIIGISLFSIGLSVVDYDSLEYHLGAPGEYFQQGRITFLRHNVYATFPALVEMLYLKAIVLSDSKMVGMAGAVCIQLFFGMLAAVACGKLAFRFLEKRAGLPAAVFFLSCPALILSVGRAHITLARCFYLVLCMFSVMEWYFREHSEKEGIRWLAVGGVCGGFAVAVKYPAALFVCAPLGLFVLATSFWKKEDLKKVIVNCAVFAGCALFAVLPWFLRNYLHTGNPVFPLFYNVFGGRGWSALQAEKFMAAHLPDSSFNPVDFFNSLWIFFTGGTKVFRFAGSLAVLFIPAVLLHTLNNGRAKSRLGRLLFLFMYACLFCILWFVFTHRIERFLVPVLAITSVLSGYGFALLMKHSTARRVVGIAATVLLFVAFYMHAGIAEGIGGFGGTFLGEGLSSTTGRAGSAGNTAYAYAVRWVNDRQNVPANSKLMLVGEAKIFYFLPELSYSVVFNDHPIEPALAAMDKGMDRAVAELRKTGVDYVLVNWSELRRLTRSYSFEWQGERHAGYLPQVNWKSREPLESLLRHSGELVASFGRINWPMKDSPNYISEIDIYRLRQVTF